MTTCLGPVRTTQKKKLITVIDRLVPICKFENNSAKTKVPPTIKNKINKRNRLLKLRKHNSTHQMKQKINDVSSKIKSNYLSQKKR